MITIFFQGLPVFGCPKTIAFFKHSSKCFTSIMNNDFVVLSKKDNCVSRTATGTTKLPKCFDALVGALTTRFSEP
ncbi:hypothetical protein ALC56_00950 [Trachymyrmex septentrionalis]|uniref:Uncharacterized protein n=1 Tax=Trachymyrmex septentrionalis TaxID=34720 RepID=A0A195FW12_9HYME|nr:hypothetical protein ALC56_00950 [Trachymyrmex septentrionalis]